MSSSPAATPIVDGHLHIWDVTRWNYAWKERFPQLHRTLLLSDYNQATAGLAIEKMVFVQCNVEPERYREEVEWISQLAAEEDQRIAGIISFCPLENGDGARPEVEELAANPLVKGIRRIVQDEPDLEFMLRPEFVRGVNALADFNLTFDLCIDYRHTMFAADFVDRCPRVKIVLDHIGKPGIDKGLLDPWRSEIRDLARRPNLWCKISSLATEADHGSWTVEELRPYTDVIFESFGIERCFFGGDWPISSLAADYQTCVATAKSLSGVSDDEERALFHDNCCEFYGV